MSTQKDKSGKVNVDQLINELKTTFLNDLPQRLDNIESIILDACPDSFHEQYETIYREAHSLKGLGGSYGIPIISNICHALEDELSAIQGKYELFSQFGVDYWLKYIDLTRNVVLQINDGKSDFTEIENELKRLQAKKSDGTVSKLNCLVVASSMIYEQMLESKFSTAPIKFSFCRNGYDALGRLLNESFDILITDYETPILNGLALIGCLHLSRPGEDITSILLTSKLQHKLERSTDPDFVVYKNKEFNDTITAIIADFLSSRA